jgi:6-phosphofructokinase (EC 2.7.1.11)
MSGIAVLTSGGDAPGMNAAVRAVVRAGIYNRFDVFGVLQGFEGLIKGNLRQMTPGSVADIIHRGGTILQTSRSQSFMTSGGREQARQVLLDQGIEHLVVIGGNGSLRGAYELSKLGCNAIGIPATIDNDIVYTQSIGFDTAVNTALEAINRIRDTATSHGRVFIIEVMGRHCGEIALSAGVAGGAESILIPEIENDLPAVVDKIKKGAERGKLHSIIVIAEGACPVMELRDYIHEKPDMI